jgi:hypothetical protein
MVVQGPVDRLNEAVQDCLGKCYLSEDVFVCLAEYTARLEAAGWQKPEIAEFRAAVYRILRGVINP